MHRVKPPTIKELANFVSEMRKAPKGNRATAEGGLIYNTTYKRDGVHIVVTESITMNAPMTVTLWEKRYHGEILDPQHFNESILEALHKHIRKELEGIPDDAPFAENPTDIRFGDYGFLNSFVVSENKFEGDDMIQYRDKLVYKAHYSGKISEEYLRRNPITN